MEDLKKKKRKVYFDQSTLSMMPYSTASFGLKYFGRLMSASISAGNFPICFAKRLTYKLENDKYVSKIAEVQRKKSCNQYSRYI